MTVNLKCKYVQLSEFTVFFHARKHIQMGSTRLGKGVTFECSADQIETCWTPGKYAMELTARCYDALWTFEGNDIETDLIARYANSSGPPGAPKGSNHCALVAIFYHLFLASVVPLLSESAWEGRPQMQARCQPSKFQFSLQGLGQIADFGLHSP